MRFDGTASRKFRSFPMLVMLFMPAVSMGHVPPVYAFGAGGVGAPAGGVAEQVAAAMIALPYGFCTVHIGPASALPSGASPPVPAVLVPPVPVPAPPVDDATVDPTVDDPPWGDPPAPVPCCVPLLLHELTRRTKRRHPAKYARSMVRHRNRSRRGEDGEKRVTFRPSRAHPARAYPRGMAYRDDLAAAQAQNEALRSELAEAQARIEELEHEKAAPPAPETSIAVVAAPAPPL